MSGASRSELAYASRAEKFALTMMSEVGGEPKLGPATSSCRCPMNRTLIPIVFLALLLSLALTPILASQEPQTEANSASAPDALAPQQLIAWSWMQKPQPMPQPVPADKAVPQPGQRPPEPEGPRAPLEPAKPAVPEQTKQATSGITPAK